MSDAQLLRRASIKSHSGSSDSAVDNAHNRASVEGDDYKILQDTRSVELSNAFTFLVLLPTQLYWQVLLVYSIILSYGFGLLEVYVPNASQGVFQIVDAFGDIIYLIDYVINIMHFCSKKLQLSFQIQPRNKYFLLIDLLTVLSQGSIIQWIFGKNRSFLHFAILDNFIRLYRVVLFFDTIFSSLTKARWKWLLIHYITIYIVLIHTSVCVLYFLLDIRNNTKNINNKLRLPMNGFDMYITCIYISVTLISNAGTEFLAHNNAPTENIYEKLFGIVGMMTGYILMTMLIAAITVLLVGMNYRKRKYAYELENIKAVVKALNASPKLNAQVLNYYNILWMNKNGVVNSPELGTLQTVLQMELMYDINIAHLQNSLLFKNQPERLLRRLSLVIEHIFLLQGDICFHQGVVKNALIFIESGIIEILSAEDDESPIISFKAGTVLGEASLMLTIPAKATVRAATYVELQVIRRHTFIRIMLEYRDEMKELRNLYTERLDRAQDSQYGLDNDNVIMNYFASNVKEFRSIKLLKEHLMESKQSEDIIGTCKDFEELTDETNKGDSGNMETQAPTQMFHPECAPLYRLCENITMIEPHKIWLTSTFPWIFDPYSSLIFSWKVLVNSIQFGLCVMHPYYIIYERVLPHPVFIYGVVADAFYLLDMFICCNTALIEKNNKILKFKSILKHQMHKFTFYLDIFSLFPMEIMTYGMNLSEDELKRLYYLLKLNRLFRIWRVQQFFAYLEKDLMRNMLVLQIIKYTFVLLLVVFYGGIFLYVTTCLYPVCLSDGWFFSEIEKAIQMREPIPRYDHPTLLSEYFAVMLLLLVGTGDVYPTNRMDNILATCLMLIGIFIVSYGTAQICAAFILEDHFRKKFQEDLFSLGRLLEHNNLPRSLYLRVLNFFQVQWFYDRAVGRYALSNTIPCHLRTELQIAELKEVLCNVPLFQMLDVDFLMIIAQGTKLQVLPKDEVIVYAGGLNREMYITISGHCEVLSDVGTILHSYGPGAHFGVIEMLFGIPKRYTIKTVTNCKVVCIEYCVFLQATGMFPIFGMEINNLIKDKEFVRMVQHITLEKQQANVMIKGKQQETKFNKKLQNCFEHFTTVIVGFFNRSFICTLMKCRRSKGLDNYWTPFAKMGKYQVFGFLLLPIAVNPEGPFIRIWCGIRIVCILAISILLPFYVSVTPYASALSRFFYGAQVCACIDIYLLMHMAYYDSKGILITHPKYTAWNYLTRNFVIDLIAVFPWALLVNLENPQHNEGHHPVQHIIIPHLSHCTWHIHCLLQFYRVPQLFWFLEKNIFLKIEFIRFLKLIPMVLVFINLGASIVIRSSCNYDFFESPLPAAPGSEIIVTDSSTNTIYYGYLNCMNGSWFQMSHFSSDDIRPHPSYLYIIAFYWLASIILSVGSGEISAQSDFDMMCILMMVILGRVLLAFAFANLASSRAAFSPIMSDYQENIRALERFLNRENVDVYWQRRVVSYFTYLWNRTSGIAPHEFCDKLNTALVEDTVLFLYERTLREVPLFETVDKTFMRVIAKHLKQQYFLRGDIVISSHDVQENIYIIHRGKVDILSSYGEMIGCMGPGGLFGNIRHGTYGCSEVTVFASRNLDVLVISSVTFYSVIKQYPKIKKNMESLLQTTAADYIMPTTIADDQNAPDDEGYEIDPSLLSGDITFSHQTLDSNRTDVSSVQHKSFASMGDKSYGTQGSVGPRKFSLKSTVKFCQPHKWFKFALLPEHTIFMTINGLVVCATYFDLITIPYMFITQINNMNLIYISLAIESIFYFKLFVSLHEAYMDKYGIYVSSFKRIARNYLNNRRQLFWDIVPNLPLEPICILFSGHTIFVLTLVRLIHLLRIEYLARYFELNNKKLHTRLLFNLGLRMVIYVSLMCHAVACTCLFASCPFGACNANSWIVKFKFDNYPSFYRYVMSFYYVVSLGTGTGIGDIYPTSIIGVLLTVFALIICRFLAALITGDMVTYLREKAKSLTNYENQISRLYDFLKNQNLSGHQMDKLWVYVQKLWTLEKGQQLPEMLNLLPYVLKYETMTIMFDQHLRNSFLFWGIDESLLKQITVHLNRIVFLKGNYIVQHGDTDQTMYFIHSGEVSVLTVHPNLTETEHQILKTQDMFGAPQGLYHELPHYFSFRANTKVCIILALKLDSWSHLLKFFPEDKKLIYNRIQNVFTNF